MTPSFQQHILFSDIFKINKSVIEGYGAFNISLVGDLPLFIDPFLIFNSQKPEYQALHEGMIRYLIFLRDKSVEGHVEHGLLNAWYKFAEVKQTWLGFSFTGNKGSGLGKKFAQELNASFHLLFAPNAVQITQSKHIEKVCLIREGVGKDNISDFTTNLIKEYLLLYTQKFAKEYLHPNQYKPFKVSKVRFNYDTESWESDTFELPFWDGDYIILAPCDLLTRDDTWINRADLINSFERVAPSLPDEQMRAQINNYFSKKLPENAKAKDKREAAKETITVFPQLIDYYIKMKEEKGDEAVFVSQKKVDYAQSLFLQKFTQLAALVAETTPFYSHGLTTIDDALARVECLKEAIENRGGHRFLYSEKHKPVAAEDELKIAYRFLWFNSVNNPTALSVQSKDAIAIDFKLASNKNIGRYLEKRDEEAIKAEEESPDVKPHVTVVFVFSSGEKTIIESHIRGLKSKSRHVRIVNAAEVIPPKEIEAVPQKNPKVFISYSHDSDQHKKRVFDLAQRLRDEGVECTIDQHMVSPREGWARWMMNNIEDADFVLVVATEIYDRRFRGKEPNKGKGAQWEGAIITQELYDANGKNDKFIPVIFEKEDDVHIPLPLRGATHFNVSEDKGYDGLYFHVTNQPPYVPTPLGKIRKRSKSDQL